ncbi:MAG TPA: SBBP repeat-containing protein [Vicinamibacterales bacterium]|nr:SBBP repeat-containing protein [Vicinamibacterales bacterium]
MINPTWRRCFLVVGLATAALPAAVVHTSENSATARAAYAQLPLRFEPSRTVSGSGTFVARGSGYAVSVSAAGATLDLRAATHDEFRRVTLSLVGGTKDAQARVRRVLPGVSNYLTGSDRTHWMTGVRGYGEVEYRGVYRGIDVVYYGNQRQLEYDFIVAPGARVEAIALAVDGATGVSVDSGGDLVIATGGGTLVQRRPTIYQNDRGTRRSVRGGYVVRRDGTIGFRVDSYDRRLPLVIDPILSYATYLGGIGQDRGYSVAVDAAGNMIVAGVTSSPDFPVANAAQPDRRGSVDAFVTKLTPGGDAIVYSTYFGGGGYDEARDVAVDAAGNAYVAGYTESFDFPVTSTIGPVEWSREMFVVKLDATGAVAYSTRAGGTRDDSLNGIAVDSGGRAHIVGMTASADFPVVNPWQPSLAGSVGFRTTNAGAAWAPLTAGLQASGIGVFGFDRAEPGAVYAGSLLEGLYKSADRGATWARANLPSQQIYAIADQAGPDPAVFAGGDLGLYRSRDRGANWTVVSPYGGAGVGALAITEGSSPVIYAALAWSSGVVKSLDGGNTWTDTGLAEPVQRLAASGSTVYAATGQRYSNGTLLKSSNGGPWEPAAGSGRDVPIGIVTSLVVHPLDPQVAYVSTNQGLFKTSSGGAAWTSVFGFSIDIWTLALAPSDPTTLFIGTSQESYFIFNDGLSFSVSGLPDNAWIGAVAFDPLDSAHVYAGSSLNQDAFVATLSPDGSRFEFATYIGGSAAESATSIAVDSSGSRYIAGDTHSDDFPTVHPVQSAFGGTWDTFVAKLSADGTPVYSTYLGGSSTDYSARIAADGAGRAYVTGLTLSTNFPVLNAAQPAHGGGFSDAFVTALDASGSALLYSTFLGGSAQETDTTQSTGPSIAVTAGGEASVAGTTQSTNFPVTADAWHRTHAGGTSDTFVATFDAAGARQYSTLLGGSGADTVRDIAIDATGTIVIAGYTQSTSWATSGALQPAYAGSDDTFVARMLPGPTPVDTVAPTTTVSLSGTAGVDGWYKSPVTVSLSAIDNDQGRGVASVEYRLTGGVFQRYTGPFTLSQSGTTTVTVRSTDWAGNVENPAPSAVLKIDTAPPTVSFQVTGTFGLAGWLKSPATVTVFAVESTPGSGVASVEYRIGDGPFEPYTASFTISSEGVTQVTARATDRNGNVRTSTQTVSIDTSAPRTTVGLSGTPGLAGWFTSPVTVALAGVDNTPGSGVGLVEYSVNDGAFNTYTAPFVVASPGATRITARSRDRAGNVQTVPTPATIMIDASQPVVTIVSPEPRDYLHTETVTLAFSAVDTVAGIQSVSAALDGTPVENAQAISLLRQSLGPHTLEVVAADAAGNSTRQAVSFRIVASIDSLIESVGLYAQQGSIEGNIQKSLLAKLNEAKAALDRGNTSSASGNLRDFIDQCQAKSGRGISAEVAAALITDAEYIRARM